MVMNKTKRITVDISSCVNCPHSTIFNSDDTLYCRIIDEWIEPSGKEPMAIYYHNIPEKCPFPNVNES